MNYCEEDGLHAIKLIAEVYLRDIRMSSGGYSNLGARGKNFQKLMLSEKKNRSDLGLHIFLLKSRYSLKKKKRSSLRFHL